MAPDRPRVAILSLGGTIASTQRPGEGGAAGVTPQLEARDLVDVVPQLREVADLEAVSFRRLPSADLTVPDLVELADEITEHFDTGIAGVVVTQGTDTIEESAFALDLLVRSPRPVVVTGAMRNPTLAGPDGPANLLAAVQVAAAPGAAGQGTLVVLNDEIHAARFVRKTHTSSPATFRSSTAGPVGWIAEGRPRFAFRIPPLGGFPAGVRADRVPPVALLTSALGDDARLATAVTGLGYAGMVLEAFGGGHVPARVAAAVRDAATRIPVVLTSRTGAGEVLRKTYGFPGSERDLLAGGLISGGFLDGPKARILLSLTLAAGADRRSVREAFGQITSCPGGSTGR